MRQIASAMRGQGEGEGIMMEVWCIKGGVGVRERVGPHRGWHDGQSPPPAAGGGRLAVVRFG